MADHPHAQSLRFRVKIDGDGDLGNWSKCDGLSVEYDVFEYKEGGENAFIHRIPGRAKYQNVKLTRPVNKDSKKAADWMAKLEEVDGVGRLDFKFNPSEYSVQKSAQWDAPRRSMSTEAGAKPEFIGTNPQTVNMQIFFDDWEAAVGDVTKDVEKLFKWCTP